VDPRLTGGEFFGDQASSRRAAGLTMTYSVYAPQLRIPRHSHDNAFFSFLRQGAYTERYGTRSVVCEAGTVILHPEDESHEDQFHETGGQVLSVEIEPSWLGRLREAAPVLSHRAELRGAAAGTLAIRLLREFEQPDALSPLAMEAIALEILVEGDRGGREEARQPPWIQVVETLLRDRLDESMSLEEIARAAGVHRVHLARAFRRHRGCTIGEYLRRLRTEYAAARLRQSDMPLVEIALAAGFNDQSQFCRVFKRQTGFTPAGYRAAWRPR
jgi:AraC family transcriptional regulator